MKEDRGGGKQLCDERTGAVTEKQYILDKEVNLL